ncbi:BA71V-B354L [Elysia marginata]|uniref:BA71V-B354L n=1 Tax=Elysia marginata TaxID=1093978 RepID=A0AAV4GSK2_9GAST|nr:BA71V-B354L [Elysia marginata]
MTERVTVNGKKVPELLLHPGLFVDRTTVIYGPSKTGKTVIVKNIMKQVYDHIEQVLLVAPTEPSNRSYAGFVDPSLIHYRMYLPDPTDKRDTEFKAAMRFLETVYKRQEMMAAIYTRANSLDTLSELYSRLSHTKRGRGDHHIASLQRMRRRVIDGVRRQYACNLGQSDQKVKEADEKFEKMLILVYKKFLTPNIESLWKEQDLNENERCCLYYLHFNPRLLLIFDDCAAQLKPFFNKEIFRKLFYQNRHSFITMIICCQDDTDLPTNLRKNAFISIFTETIVCTSNFDRGSNRFPKATKAYVAEIAPEVFIGFRKLAYIREDDKRQHFYHLTCTYPRPFLFGSNALSELCATVRSEGVTMDTDNPFYEKFRV